MSDKKDIEVSNGAFDLKIHWNKGVMSLQSALLMGCGAIFICTNSKTVRSFILLALIVDALCVVFYFISTHKKQGAENASEQTSEEQDTAPPNTDVRHNRSRNKSVRSTNATIKNRVAAPVSNMPTHHDAMQQEAMAGSTPPQTEVELTPTVPVERPVDTPPVEEQPPQQQTNAEVDLHEDLGDDWGNFFDI